MISPKAANIITAILIVIGCGVLIYFLIKYFNIAFIGWWGGLVVLGLLILWLVVGLKHLDE